MYFLRTTINPTTKKEKTMVNFGYLSTYQPTGCRATTDTNGDYLKPYQILTLLCVEINYATKHLIKKNI